MAIRGPLPKLTQEQLAELRNLRRTKNVTYRKLATYIYTTHGFYLSAKSVYNYINNPHKRGK